MCLDDLWDRMVELTQNDESYQEALDRVKRLEPAFLTMRESLNPRQQILDDYIAPVKRWSNAKYIWRLRSV